MRSLPRPAVTRANGQDCAVSGNELERTNPGVYLNGAEWSPRHVSDELFGWKGASAASTARSAIFCAYIARHGMTGLNAIFEGKMGLLHQVSGAFNLDVVAFGS